jgi:chlorite dismutase
MEITERLKEIILQETNIDININSRKSNVIETRALYFKLLKQYNPFLTLEYIGDTVNKNHATVIHSLRKYNMYENYNNDLRNLRIIICRKIDEENLMNTNDNETLKIQLKKVKNNNALLEYKIEELELQLKQKSNSIYEHKIITNLNKLMTQTKGTEKYNLILIRLEAFYEMNKIKTDTWYDESKEKRMNIIGQNGNDGTHYGKIK